MSDISGDLYPGQEPETFNRWFPIEHELLEGIPFRLHICKLESGKQPITDLVMDPRPTLQGKGEGGLPPLPGVDDDTRVTTTLIGHERSLRLRAILLIAVSDEQDNSVSITSHKQRP
jgi:hypothetical protein